MERAPLVPAATAVLLRDQDSDVETLLLRRSADLAFAGGRWVFPGGRVDPADSGDHADGDVDTELGAERRAAVREIWEEAGLELTPGELVPSGRGPSSTHPDA